MLMTSEGRHQKDQLFRVLHMAAKWWHVTARLSRDIATRSRD